MPRFRWWKAVGVVWARILITLASSAICFNSSAAYVIGLAERKQATTSDLATALIIMASPGLYGVLVFIVFVTPALVVAMLHYLWAWFLRFTWSRWPIPRLSNSLWEGFLSVMVFWSGMVISLALLLPFIPIRPDRPPTEAELNPVAGAAVWVVLAIWNFLFFLEMRARHHPGTRAPAPAPQSPPPDPIESEIDRLKRVQAARGRQQAIASANEWEMAAKKSPAAPRRQAQNQTTNPAPPAEHDPFGDANF